MGDAILAWLTALAVCLGVVALAAAAVAGFDS